MTKRRKRGISPQAFGRKAISVRQPWTDMIVYGVKWCENRSWRTTYRGPLYIHASSNVDRFEMKQWREKGIEPLTDSPGKCKLSSIIGQVDLIACIEIEKMMAIKEGDADVVLTSEESLLSIEQFRKSMPESTDWSWELVEGPWCFILANAKPLSRSIPCHGKLGIWTL